MNVIYQNILKMFEASYLNNIETKCHEHPRNPITCLCLDYKCTENPYLCNECMASIGQKQKHYGHDLQVKDVILAAEELSNTINRTRKPIESMYAKLTADKQNDSLLKYQEERQQHCQSIRAHIETIKFQIDEEIKGIGKAFEKELQKQKDNMYGELERYYENYRQKFEYLSRKVGPVAAMTKSYKYYASKHNILLKLLADSDPNSSIRWFIDLKRTVRAAEVLSNDPATQYDKIKKISSATNDLIDQLPRVKSTEYETHLPRLLNSTAKEVIKQMVKFGENRNLGSISRSHSMQMDGQYSTKNNDISRVSRV